MGMRFASTPRVRIFLIAWCVYGLFFSTNVVREHYPAFALIDQGNFRVDSYAGFHSDIFHHRDGHHYIGNQVTCSVLAALPLLLVDPLLDAVEAYEKRNPRPAAPMDTEYPNRQAFYEKVREKGLVLRFGASTFVTSWLFNAPIAALLVASLLGFLLERGIRERRAIVYAALFAFGTPLFYRASHLSHTVVLTAATWFSFRLLTHLGSQVGGRRLALAGFFAGLSLALDYAGVIPLLCLYALAIAKTGPDEKLFARITRTLPFVFGTFLPVAFLLYSQWDMYGHPIWPGQYWMRAVHYTEEGFRGFSKPSLDLFASNLFHPDWGLLTFAPILALAFLPKAWTKAKSLLRGRSESVFVLVYLGLFLTFCAANQYSRMQWNTGFRYLLPLVPFLLVATVPHLEGPLRRWAPLAVLLSVIHQVVLCMARFTPVDWQDGRRAVSESWRRVLDSGPTLPALEVARNALPSLGFLASPIATAFIVIATAVLSFIFLKGSKTGVSEPL